MIVAIARGLEGFKEKLEQRGYQVVYEDEYSYPVDAYIYINHPNWMEFSDEIRPELTSSIEKRSQHKHQGVLIINAQNKSIDEIEQILNNRVYSPLF
ncbi:MAG: hypothetical protein GX209_05735 [Epulopiscium sp.]|nr:hypothetical protein [Candidatus Epulonipiscium sp.]